MVFASDLKNLDCLLGQKMWGNKKTKTLNFRPLSADLDFNLLWGPFKPLALFKLGPAEVRVARQTELDPLMAFACRFEKHSRVNFFCWSNKKKYS